MCGRFALSAPASRLIEFFELDECVEFLANRNIETVLRSIPNCLAAARSLVPSTITARLTFA